MPHARVLDMPPQVAARIGGFLYLLIIAGGLFAQVFVRERLIVAGDATATAGNLLQHATLYRLGFGVHLFYLLCAIVLAVILYDMLRRVSASLALLALGFDVVAIAVEGIHLLHHLAPLLMLTDRGLAGMEPDQLHAMAYAQARLFAYGFGISLVFFGVFCIVAGVLIHRSRFLPRTLGVMMVIAGICYLVNSFALLLAPAMASLLFPYILMPCLLAELSLALWLLVKGIKVEGLDAAPQGGAVHQPDPEPCAR